MIKVYLSILIFWITASNAALFTYNPDGGYIDCHSDPSMCFTNTISISCTVRVGPRNDSISGEKRILSKMNNADTVIQFALSRWQAGDAQNEKLVFEYDSPSGAEYWFTDAQVFLNQTNIYHRIGVSFTFGTGSSMQCYFDGVLQAGTWVLGTGNKFCLTNAQSLKIGTGSAGTTWQGEITEVAIWNGILTSAQLKVLSSDRVTQTPMEISPGSLVGYWSLDAFPAWVNPTSTSTNRYRNMSRATLGQNDGTVINTCTLIGEALFSYPPNE